MTSPTTRRQPGRPRHAAGDRRGEAEPREIGYINAHGSSTPLNDPTENGAIRQVFGASAETVPISGTKGYYGHALGASGAFEAAICALASQRRWLPPTVNLAEPDPACDLSYLAGEGGEGGSGVSPQQFVRLRRHQRMPGIQTRRLIVKSLYRRSGSM